MQAEHAQGLGQGLQQACLAEIVRGDEAVAVSQEDADAGPPAEGGGDARDRLLLGQHAQMIGALKEHLHQIGSCRATAVQQQFEQIPAHLGGESGGEELGGRQTVRRRSGHQRGWLPLGHSA